MRPPHVVDDQQRRLPLVEQRAQLRLGDAQVGGRGGLARQLDAQPADQLGQGRPADRGPAHVHPEHPAREPLCDLRMPARLGGQRRLAEPGRTLDPRHAHLVRAGDGQRRQQLLQQLRAGGQSADARGRVRPARSPRPLALQLDDHLRVVVTDLHGFRAAQIGRRARRVRRPAVLRFRPRRLYAHRRRRSSSLVVLAVFAPPCSRAGRRGPPPPSPSHRAGRPLHAPPAPRPAVE
jgi:hypothetical protein